MQVRKKFTLFFSLSFIILFAAFIASYFFYKQRQYLHKQNEFQKRQYNANVSLGIQSKSLQRFTADYTIWDEMIRFIKKPDTTWAMDNINPLLSTAGINYVWIYNTKKKKVYHLKDSLSPVFPEPFPAKTLGMLFDSTENSVKKFSHFYLKLYSQIVEISGGTVFSTLDVNRSKKPNGFVFLGRILKPDYFKELEIITNAKVSLSTDTIQEELSKAKDIIVKENLYDWKNVALMAINFKGDDEFMKREDKYNLYTLVAYSLVILLLIFNAYFFINLQISKPLANISKSLDTQNTTFIAKEIKQTNEFGQISRLINSFFDHKKELEKEIEERKRVQIELKDANARLNEHNEEILQQNEVLQQQKEEILAQTEQLDLLNKDLERLSIVASKTENMVIIADADGEIEWVNISFEKVLGISLEEFKLRYGSNIYKNSLNPDINSVISEVSKKGISAYYSSKTITRDGKNIWLHTTLTPIFDEWGKLRKLIFIDSDITKIKLAEEKIEKQNHNITQSINYAKRIQEALLPTEDIFKLVFIDHFILYKPKDIISGDFYWINQIDHYACIAAADCTGHGVPGAIMSMLGYSFLNEISNSMPNNKFAENQAASYILDELRNKIIQALHQKDERIESRDGMDIALCIIDLDNMQMQFAGAHNVLLISRINKNGTGQERIDEYKGDHLSVSVGRDEVHFSNHNIQLEKGDILYMFSDGYADQNGGPNKKKFMRANLKKLLSGICEKGLDEQKAILEDTFIKWKGDEVQVDDILFMGLKV